MTKGEYIIHAYEMDLLKTHTFTEMENLIYPMRWYINTGRASANYISRLGDARTKHIIAILEAGGTVEEVCKRLKDYLYR